MEVDIINSVDEAWGWGRDAGCPFVAWLSGNNVGNKVDEALNIGMVYSVDPDKPFLMPKMKKLMQASLAGVVFSFVNH